MPGVKRVAMTNWFGGSLPAKKEGKAEEESSTTDWSNFFPNLAVELEPYFAMYPEYQVPPDQWQALLADQRGCAIGRKLADKFGWKIGDTFYLESFIPPAPQGGRPLRVRGEGDLRHRPRQVPRHRHEPDAVQPQVPLRGDRADAPGRAPTRSRSTTRTRRATVSAAIDALFENSDAQTRTETEKAFAASFVAMAGNLALLLNGIGLAVTFTILLVVANTMSIAVRERRKEIGVLKTLGFTSGQVMGLVVAESVLIALLGGALGVLGSQGILWLLTHAPGMKSLVATIGLSELSIPPLVAALGFGNAALPRLRRRLRARLLRLPRPHHRHAEDGLTMALPLYYNVRNVRVRWQLTLLAVGGIALVVAVFAVLMSMSEGFAAALRTTGRPDNAIVVQRGSGSELTSGVPLADRNMIMVDERVARDASGQPLASWELVVVIGLPRASDGQPANVTLRAVTPRAFEVRGGITVVEGRSFTPGLDEVIVGKKLTKRIKGLEIGGNVKYQQKLFKIVGLFESTGGAFESEVWGDYDTFAAIFQRGAGSNSLVVRMKDPAAIPELDRWIRAQPQMQLQAQSERRYYEEQAGPLARALRGLATFVAVVMGMGAVFGAINTMYAIVAVAHPRDRHPARPRLLAALDPRLLPHRVGHPRRDRGSDRLPAGLPHERLLDRHRPDPELQRDRLRLPHHPRHRPHRDGLRGGDGSPRRPPPGAARRPPADHVGARERPKRRPPAAGFRCRSPFLSCPFPLAPREGPDEGRPPSLLWQDDPSMTPRALAAVRPPPRSRRLLRSRRPAARPRPRPGPRFRRRPSRSRAAKRLRRRSAAPGAAATAAVDPDDPAEPGIPDLARLARYVFKTMQRHEEVCPFENPYRERLHLALAIDVRKGRITRVGTSHVGVEPEKGEARTLAPGQVPRALTAYVTCLAPHLQAVTMAPSPADGVYEPVYTFGGQAAGQPAP